VIIAKSATNGVRLNSEVSHVSKNLVMETFPIIRRFSPADPLPHVSDRVDHDRARLAAQTIHLWWNQIRCNRYRIAEELLIIADAGGSKGFRAVYTSTHSGLPIGMGQIPRP
jgi:hypothetical protein